MQRVFAILSVSALVACASPSPEFAGAVQTRIAVDGVQVAVFHKGARAQAIRLDYARREAQRAMPARLATAIETVTGCTVRPGSLQGDSGVVTADLICA